MRQPFPIPEPARNVVSHVILQDLIQCRPAAFLLLALLNSFPDSVACKTCLRYSQTMPIVFRYKGFRFFFYSNEGSPREPLHVHVRGDGCEAKFWLKPAPRVAESDGFDSRTLRELLQVVEQNAELIERSWNEHFR